MQSWFERLGRVAWLDFEWGTMEGHTFERKGVTSMSLVFYHFYLMIIGHWGD